MTEHTWTDRVRLDTPYAPVLDFGLRVVVSPYLPVPPSPGEEARRIVRHGFDQTHLNGMRSSVLRWLGEKPGPKPEEQSHAYALGDGTMIVSQHYADLITRTLGPSR